MRRSWFSWIAASLLLLMPLMAASPSLQAQTALADPATPGRVIVKFRSDASVLRKQSQSAGNTTATATSGRERAASLGARTGLTLASGAMVSGQMQVVTAAGIDSAELARRLSAQSDVEYAVPDQRRHRFAPANDPRYAAGLGGNGPAVGQWYLRAPSGGVRSAINAEAAWDISTGSPNLVVAVLDTGIRADHEDLQANLLPGYDMVEADSAGVFLTANDGDGRDADPSDPGDWIDSADRGTAFFANCTLEPSSWHGTQTAGLIGAVTDNAIGMASVGRTVRLLPVRVLGKCGGQDSDILAGMRWAAGLAVAGVPANTNPAKVINMSLGGDGPCSQAYIDTVSELAAVGVVVVVSAGNSAGHAVSSPANCPGVIGVTGLRHVGTKVGFADVGTQVAIAAPGGNCINLGPGDPCLYPILTATNPGATTPTVGVSSYSDSYDTSVGTSFSAPLVAGTVGLMLSVRPGMSVAEVRSALQASTRPFPISGSDSSGTVPVCRAPTSTQQLECYCTTSTCGAGMLDANNSVGAVTRGVQARVTLSNDRPTAEVLLSLSANTSFVLSGRTIDTYQWSLIDGGGIVTALSSASGPTATLTPTGAGTFIVSLAVVDSTGQQSTMQRTVEVAAAVVIAPPLPEGGGGGGGGALGWAWLSGLALAVAALQFMRNRRTGF